MNELVVLLNRLMSICNRVDCKALYIVKCYFIIQFILFIFVILLHSIAYL